MKISPGAITRLSAFVFLVLQLIPSANVANAQQTIGFGIHADPLIGWFSSDNNNVTNESVKAGLNFGMTFNRYFTENYAFSAGLSLITAGGGLSHNDTITLLLKNEETIPPGNTVIYNIKYLAVPVGLKLQSNQIGYITYFTDLGFDPKFVLGGKAEIPTMNIEKEDATAELNNFNMGYHITAGIEYSLGGTTAIVLGLTFDSNFIDITRENGDQPSDRILHKMLGFRIGINF
jgi:hypothetical protein